MLRPGDRAGWTWSLLNPIAGCVSRVDDPTGEVGLHWPLKVKNIMDPLSDVLKSLKMCNAAIGALQLSAPWGFRVEGLDCPTALGVAEGPPCWLNLPGQEPIMLEQGDIALFTRAKQYSMQSAPDVKCEDFP